MPPRKHGVQSTCVALDAHAHGLRVAEGQHGPRFGRAHEAEDEAAAPATPNVGEREGWGGGVGGRCRRPRCAQPAVMASNVEPKRLAAAHAHVGVAVLLPSGARSLPQLPDELALRH
jgi:hypothetical protein